MPSFFSMRDLLSVWECSNCDKFDMLPNAKEDDLANPVVKKGFMPFGNTILTKSLVEYAATFLNETEEIRKRSILEIREIIRDVLGYQAKDKDILTDTYILCYLRARKFNMKRSVTLLKGTLSFFVANQDIFSRSDSEIICRVVESNIIGFLPYRDSKGRGVINLRFEAWNPDLINIEDLIFGSIVAMHVAIENPINQVAGLVVILNFKNFNFQQFRASRSWIKFVVQALQKCCPLPVKEIHIVNTSMIFQIFWKLVSSLLNEKMTKRIKVHQCNNWKSLHQSLPPDILPEELGGHLGLFSNEHWASDISMLEDKFNMTFHMVIDRYKNLMMLSHQ